MAKWSNLSSSKRGKSQSCRCCTMFDPSNYRQKGDSIFTNIGRKGTANRSHLLSEDYELVTAIKRQRTDNKRNGSFIIGIVGKSLL